MYENDEINQSINQSKTMNKNLNTILQFPNTKAARESRVPFTYGLGCLTLGVNGDDQTAFLKVKFMQCMTGFR